MARVYTNENFPLPVAAALRELGHDVLTSLDAGNAKHSVPDQAVLAYASGESRILLALNRKHFIRLHSLDANHAGIVTCTFDPDFPGQARRIHEVISGVEDFSDTLARINRPPA